jgi:6-phosphogluconolactonase/glucosamine-6-phosphate isomerase/deaminase
MRARQIDEDGHTSSAFPGSADLERQRGLSDPSLA